MNEVSLDDIIQDDSFELIDKKIISELANLICDEAISSDRLNQLVKQRENKYWYLDYEDFYNCLGAGMHMITQIRKIEKTKFQTVTVEFSDGERSII